MVQYIFRIISLLLLTQAAQITAQGVENIGSAAAGPEKEISYKDSVNEEAFDALSETISPLNSDQVKKVRRLWNESQRMATFTGETPPVPTNSSMMVNLDNGSLPTVIRLSAGYVSVISFFDATGQIWPIKGYDIGNPSAVNIVWNQPQSGEDIEDSHSNTLLMQAQTIYKTTNMVVMLQGLSTPILLEIVPGQKAIDYRLDLQVPRLGPFAKETAFDIPTSANPVMLDILNNIPPNKSVQAHVQGGEAQAWIYKKKMYVRTPLEIISPAWMAKINGANDSMHVYELPVTSALVALNNGKVVKLQVEGV